MLKIAYIQPENIEKKPAAKKLTKKESEYLDSLNWATQQRALDRKEARKFYDQEAAKIGRYSNRNQGMD